MAEDVLMGQPAQPDMPVPPAPPAEPVLPGQQTPAAQTPPPVPVFGGKTPDQIVQELEEQRRYITQLNERAARAEYEANYARTLYEQSRKKQEEAQPAIQVSEEEYVQNPIQATVRIVQQALERDKAERERKEREQYLNTARNNYDVGRREATRRNPRIFNGIENEVANEVFRAFEKGAVNSEALANPEFWEASAAMLRIAKGDWDLARYRNTQPVSPAYTETPSPQRPPMGSVSLTPEQEEAARLGGFTRERFLQMLQETKNEAVRRAQ